MGYAPRILPPGGIHHVGNNQTPGKVLFPANADRLRFLALLGETAVQYRLRIQSWCLMNTHFHLLVEDPDAQLSDAMRCLSGRFAFERNHRAAEQGQVFKRRFWARHVLDERRFQRVAMYIAMNPVDAGLVSHPARYPWGSHFAIARGRVDPLTDTDRLFTSFGSREGYLGAIEDAVRHGAPPPEGVPAEILELTRPTLARLLDGRDRGDGIALARAYGYRLREIADFLGVSTASVHRWSAAARKTL